MAISPVIVPSNQIVTSKYTIGNEYIDTSTYKDYQGYYYELNGKAFVGKIFNVTASVLIKKDSTSINPLLSNPLLSTYGKLTTLPDTTINSQPEPPYIANTLATPNPEDKEDPEVLYSAYFYKKIINGDILIKQISKETYDQYKSNPLYNMIEVKISEGDVTIDPSELNNAEKQMPGFADWILSAKRPGE